MQMFILNQKKLILWHQENSTSQYLQRDKNSSQSLWLLTCFKEKDINQLLGQEDKSEILRPLSSIHKGAT
jgi:hypothetical protein